WLDELPGGAHFRVRGRELLMLWTFEEHLSDAPVYPPRFDPDLGEALIRGLRAMIPGIDAYFGRGPGCRIDGGYYCKAPDNRPLVGPLGIDGAYVIGALSGYGIMGSQAAAELLADHLTGSPLPAHAALADPWRLADPDFLARAAALDTRSGQL
ncbi:MAG: FAD-binding oxidoreductase, partial [Myxococcales bacterium]|nr:FAD-binding oxidoreductase [Myxococcales bacterium]